MRILEDAKALSRMFGVAVVLYLLPIPAHAGVGSDDLRPHEAPEFSVGSGMSPAMLSFRDPGVVWPTAGPDGETGAVGTMQLGATGFTLAPVGLLTEAHWDQFNIGEWQMSDDATEIPEPAPLAILGIAILGLGFYRRRRSSGRSSI